MAKKENLGGVWLWLSVTRVLLGVVFLWAFVDKLFGLGIATPAARAWLNGGSPTTGFLKNVEGPFASFFNGIAGQPWADWLFMAGLLGIGVALVLGVALRLAAWSGVVMMVLMWAASMPLENNPVVDDHLVYATALLAIAAARSNQRFSVANWWLKLGFVKKNAWLQ
jgi:thiosulfate dehydrogenase [quinone] large subunit